jgi:selenocysteine lyase/cysteine desulfurase
MTKLENENIYLSRRGPGLRIAPHLFNDRRDIERLFAVLDGLTE